MSQTRWDSDSNQVPFIFLSEAEVIAIVNRALSSNAARTSTYKFAFFKAILDNVFNVDIDTMFLSYDSIALRFTEIYWNLVLACPHCNSSKSNILPDRQYFAEIKERNNKLSNIDLPIVKHDFKTYSYFKLEEMWHSAVFNGFEDGWRARG